ncbi:MAG TPA: ankyrin repeat domain-containing protein, partial [Terriglobales bacterium]|nr:ankyrin repeat domain-containing protein [Terriglobales bacterium]
QTALIIACRMPHVPPELVKALLAAGADVNTRSRNDYTALSWATTRGNTEVIQLLRRSGARP